MANAYQQIIRRARMGTQEGWPVPGTENVLSVSLLGLDQDGQRMGTSQGKVVADQMANEIRKSYGVPTASATNPSAAAVPGAQTVGSFGTAALETPASPSGTAYRNIIAQAAQKPMQEQGTGLSFLYDPETDPVMAAYRKMYLREGQRASENAMAQAAAATGGVPSSYAVMAANQVGNYYAAQLADKIPELSQDAYGRYIDRFQNALTLYNKLGYATPEIAEILGLEASNGEASGGGYGGSTGENLNSSYNNDSVSENSVRHIQIAMGIEPTGRWDTASQLAAGGMSAEEAWKAYNQGQLGHAVGVSEKYANAAAIKNGMLTQEQWNRNMDAYITHGIYAEGVENSTYEEYTRMWREFHGLH